MKPAEEPAKSEPAQTPAAPAPANTPAAEASLAEPPKNIEFTEVPADSPSSVVGTVHTEHSGEVMDRQPTPKPTPKPHKASTGSKPVLALSVVFLLFIVLAAVAYYAYTKSQ